MFIINGPRFGVTHEILYALALDGVADTLTRSFTSSSTHSGSVWIKRNKLGATQNIFGTTIYFNSSDQLVINALTSTRVFRDTAAFFCLHWNSTGAYINGVLLTGTGTYATSALSSPSVGGPTNFLEAEIAQFIFGDGQDWAISVSGEASTTTGEWVPANPSDATFGTEGFYQDYAVAPGTGNGAGTDVSGNIAQQLISNSVGTNTYYPTPSHNTAAGRDGDTTQSDAASTKWTDGLSTVHYGADWGSGVAKTLTGFKVYASLDNGGLHQSATNGTFTLQGSNVASPDQSTDTDWTDLGNTGSVDVATNGISHEVLTGLTTTTAYRHHRIRAGSYTGSTTARPKLAEVEFYETTANNFTDVSLTAASQVTDTPTDNFAALNPLSEDRVGTLSNNNLTIAGGSEHQVGTFPLTPTSKATWEIVVGTTESQSYGIELAGGAQTETLYTASFTAADVIQMRYDGSAGTLDRKLNAGSWTSVATSLTDIYVPLFKGDCTVDFGQRGFTGTDAGVEYKLLSSDNIPEPAISDPREHHHLAVIDTSVSSSGVAEFDLDDYHYRVTIKSITGTAGDAIVIDTLRGITKWWPLNDATVSEQTDVNMWSVSGSGYTLGSTFGSSDKYTVEIDKAGLVADEAANTAGATNTTKTSFNPTSRFFMHLFEGTGANTDLGNPLGVAVDYMEFRSMDSATRSAVYHSKMATNPGTAAVKTDSAGAIDVDSTYWNDAATTTSLIYLGSAANTNRASTMMAYGWGNVDGYSRADVYEGNTVADGSNLNVGFYPGSWISKALDTANNWNYYNTVMSTYNAVDKFLIPNTTAIAANPSASNVQVDFVSYGAKQRGTSAGSNQNTIIFFARGGTPNGNAR